jgi:sugar lactone lactonase YvrE
MHTGSFTEAAETTGYALVWNLRSPSRPPERLPTGTFYQGMALSPDGRTLYTNRPLTAYDVTSGARIWRRDDVISHLTLDVNATGTLLASRTT